MAPEKSGKGGQVNWLRGNTFQGQKHGCKDFGLGASLFELRPHRSLPASVFAIATPRHVRLHSLGFAFSYDPTGRATTGQDDPTGWDSLSS
jgi:hypothetical protein